MLFSTLLIFGFLFGIGFGFFVQRAGLCFAHGMAEIFIGKGKRIVRLFSIIFIITGMGFMLSAYFNPELGLKPVGEIRGAGFLNLISGIIFGAGIYLNGGCILGTLRQIGEGHMNFLVVLLALIPGMAFVVYGLDPLLSDRYQTQKLLLPDLFGVPAVFITISLAIGAVIWYLTVSRKKVKKTITEKMV